MPLPDDTKTRLLDAAGKVFAEKGRDQASVRDILKEAGIKNIAAVNYYFGDKDSLYEASLRHTFKCRLDEMPLPEWPVGMPPEVKLRMFIRGVVSHMLKDQHPWQ